MIKTTRSHPLIELLGQFVDTVKAMWRRKASVNEIVRLDQQEAARISRDLGISTHDLHALVGEGKNAADLLVRRITTLGLEPKKLDHAIMHDLQRCCSLCGEKQLCAHELEDKPKEATWPRYCPNEYTLAALATKPASSASPGTNLDRGPIDQDQRPL